MAWIQPSSTPEREPWGIAAGCGLVPAWGETDEYANRYHEHASHSKRAAGARTDQIHAHSAPWTLAVGAGQRPKGQSRATGTRPGQQGGPTIRLKDRISGGAKMSV